MKPGWKWGFLVGMVFGLYQLAGASQAESPNWKKPFAMDFPDKSIPALELEIETINGKSVRLGEFKGQIILINFWTTWCVPCVREMPDLNKLSQTLKSKNFVILAVNVREPQGRVLRFLERHDVSQMRIGLDLKGKTYKKYGVGQFPTSFIIDQEGQFVARIRGERLWSSPQSIRYFQQLIRDS